MNRIPEIFSAPVINRRRLRTLESVSDPRIKYIIAITPRSGSSYLCDVMARTRRLGMPGEMLNQELIPDLLNKIPGRTPDEYLRNVFRVRKTRNGISGFKVSWFQFENFLSALKGNKHLSGIQYIYLTRRDLPAQAISLYKATESSVFHTNIKHSEAALTRLKSLEYNFDEINNWYEHIRRQEEGWEKYFFQKKIFPLCVNYEDIERDILAVMKRIATFVRVNPQNVLMPAKASVFRKMGDGTNISWANRFRTDRFSLDERIEN